MNVCNINIMNNSYKSLFLLDPKITYLNHGSFGACPRPIFDSLISWQKKLENDPVKHLAFDIYDYLEKSRIDLASSSMLTLSVGIVFASAWPREPVVKAIRSISPIPVDIG